jgi:hypothetical protein
LGATSSNVGNEVIRVQVEGVTEVTEGENREPITSPLTDPGKCVRLIKKEPDSGSKACVTALDDGTEEGNTEVDESVDVKEKGPEALTFPQIKPEPENCIDLRSSE